MTQITTLDMAEIVPGSNDRTVFEPQALQELADNIRAHGLIQPITVRRIDGTDLWQIVAGERRYRACRLLGWTEMPCLVRDLSDREASAVMLQENMSRANLDPIDEAAAYSRRMQEFGWTVSEVASAAGVSEVRVQFRLKLLRLRPKIQALVRQGSLQMGYAQVLSDGDLDSNRQMLALRRLRDNPNPSPAWFRRVVGELFQQQAQGELFELPLLAGDGGAGLPMATPEEPPHPSSSKPPRVGRTASEVLSNQVGFWSEAAEAWDQLGKPFKRQECQAAAQALQLAIAVL